MVGSDKWNSAFVWDFFFVLQKGFPVFCNDLVNCRLDCVDFIAFIAQMNIFNIRVVNLLEIPLKVWGGLQLDGLR